MKVKLLLVAEIEVEQEDTALYEAVKKFDAFREAVSPGQEYGISIWQARAVDLDAFALPSQNAVVSKE